MPNKVQPCAGCGAHQDNGSRRPGQQRLDPTARRLYLSELLCSGFLIATPPAGIIDYEEFIACTVHLNRLEQESAFQAAFEAFDTDHSGCLSVDEIGDALKAGIFSLRHSELWNAGSADLWPCVLFKEDFLD